MNYRLKFALTFMTITLVLFAALLSVTQFVWPSLLASGPGIVAASVAGPVCGMVGVFAAYAILEALERRHDAHPDSNPQNGDRNDG